MTTADQCEMLEGYLTLNFRGKGSATVIDILKNKGYLENYGKSVDVFKELQEHQPEAIQYAKERVERLTRDQVAVICRDSNPVTTVYELVEFLNMQRAFFVKMIFNHVDFQLFLTQKEL